MRSAPIDRVAIFVGLRIEIPVVVIISATTAVVASFASYLWDNFFLVVVLSSWRLFGGRPSARKGTAECGGSYHKTPPDLRSSAMPWGYLVHGIAPPTRVLCRISWPSCALHRCPRILSACIRACLIRVGGRFVLDSFSPIPQNIFFFFSAFVPFLFLCFFSCAWARQCNQTRLRKRAKQSRRLASTLTIPKDVRGEPIRVHTAAYNGESDLLSAYISQGGDLEVRESVSFGVAAAPLQYSRYMPAGLHSTRRTNWSLVDSIRDPPPCQAAG